MIPFDEIGSEYWKADTGRDTKNEISGAVFTASGRSAQSLVIQSVKSKNKKALLPAYTCQHMVEPFAWTGWEVDYYDIKQDLTIELTSLKKAIAKEPGCIVVQSYYGFNTTKQAEPFLLAAQQTGAMIMEDITHCFLSGWSPGYRRADYQFCSLRKWTGLTDGGYALSVCGDALGTPGQEMTKFAEDRFQARTMKNRYTKEGDSKDKEAYLQLFRQAEDLLDHDIQVYTMSERAKEEFYRTDFFFIKKKRQENYRCLLQSIESDHVKPIFGELSDDTCPIMFPVYVGKERSALRQKLIDHRIYCPIHWPAPIQLTPAARLSSDGIYNHIMSIPCDQRYGAEEMQRIAHLINTFLWK